MVVISERKENIRRKGVGKTKKLSVLLLFLFITLIGFNNYHLNKDTILDKEDMEIYGTKRDTEEIVNLTESSFSEDKMWQDAYADLLRQFLGSNFYLCDIDGNGIPELLIGGPSSDTYKEAEFDVYSYKHDLVECIGTVSTLRYSSLWLDHNGSIFGYSYGAGGGGTYRFYIDNGVLYYDGAVNGYRYDGEGNYTEWFRGPNGDEIIITKENKLDYEKVWKSWTELERYVATNDTISHIIYSERN